MNKLIDDVGNWNPQLFRELKGRFTRSKVAIAVGVSLAVQLLVYLSYFGKLPDDFETNAYSRYCTGNPEEYLHSTVQCLASGGAWQINWQLWHFDLFVTLSLMGMGILLILGSHLINADLVKEEKRGTLGFVRLSPQPVQRIILGKILGVPSLIYLGLAAALPLHLITGLSAGISLPWIGMVYGMAIAAAVAFFSMAALWSFMGLEFFGEFRTWLYSGTLGGYLFFLTLISLDSGLPSKDPLDWLRMLYPGNVFYYLVDRNSLPWEKIDYFHPQNWFDTHWYNSSAWVSGLWGLGFILGHYVLLSVVAWHGIHRRFYDPQMPVMSKKMGYGVAIAATVLMTGFALVSDEDYRFLDNFQILQGFYLILFVGLAILMTPTRQRVQDWQRFRHQGQFARRLWADLLWGNRSPALVAIALSLIITTGFMAIMVLNSPTLTHKMPILSGLALQMGTLFIFAGLIQFIFLQRQKRGVWLVGTIGGLTVMPLIIFTIFHEQFTGAIAFGLFSVFPLVAIDKALSSVILWSIAAQWLGMIVGTWVLQKQIRYLGNSELKTLLTSSGESQKNMLI